MAIAAYNSTSKGYVPSLSSEAKASLEKGRQEREAKAVAQTGSTQPATATKATSAATQTAGTAAKPATQSSAPSSSVVNISNAARARLEAERTGATGTATAGADVTAGKPKAVRFNSVDDAIAYGTRKANEQAAARQGLQSQSGAETNSPTAKVEPSQSNNTKKGYVPELSADAKASIEKGRQERAAAEKASASQKAGASQTAGASAMV